MTINIKEYYSIIIAPAISLIIYVDDIVVGNNDAEIVKLLVAISSLTHNIPHPLSQSCLLLMSARLCLLTFAQSILNVFFAIVSLAVIGRQVPN